MKLPSSALAVIALCLVSPLLTSHTVQAACSRSTAGAIDCPDFGGDISLLALIGVAKQFDPRNPITAGPGLRLTGTEDGCVSGACCVFPNRLDARGQTGIAWSQVPIELGGDGASGSFSTRFQFQITCPGGYNNDDAGDGLTFTLQSLSNHAGYSGGLGGLGNVAVDKSVSIEFDTYRNGGFYCNNDPNNNHIGLDINGQILDCNIPDPSGGYTAVTYNLPFALVSGDIITAWVDYNGTDIKAYAASGATAVKPASPFIARTLDLVNILGSTSAYAGFTAGTGGAQENHDILNWNFNPRYAPDTQGPQITVLDVPSSIVAGASSITVSGTASDAGKGDSQVTSVTYTLDSGAPVTIAGISPAVTVTFQPIITGLETFPITSSPHKLCFTATDAATNVGPQNCKEFTVAPPPGFCITTTGVPGVCAQNCGKGVSGCNCFDLQVVSGKCVPCTKGVQGTPPNSACVASDGAKAGSARAAAGTTYCNAAKPSQPCAVDMSCNNGGGSLCGGGPQKCCHF